MLEQPNIQWYPGHMKKTEGMIKSNLSYVDIVAELLDARIPRSSTNPKINQLIGKKAHIILLNKADMADPAVTKEWIDFFRSLGLVAISFSCKDKKHIEIFQKTVQSQLRDVQERNKNKGMTTRALRVMVVGVPNVGKSTFINTIAGSTHTKAEDRPGVTRQKQWVHLSKQIDLLDMPGTLWPKLEDKETGLHLAFTGAIKDDILDVELIAMHLLEYLCQFYFERLKQRFKIDKTFASLDAFERLEQLGRKRGMLLSGNEVDTQRAAITLLDEFRKGRLGLISLERPETFQIEV